MHILILKFYLLVTLFYVTGLSLSAFPAEKLQPLIHFNFTNGSKLNTGSLGGQLELVSGSTTSPKVTKLAGGIWAFDNSQATNMGNMAERGENGFMRIPLNGAFDNLLSFTITGWFKTTDNVPLNSNAQLISAEGTALIRANPNGFRLTGSVYWDSNKHETVVGAQGVNNLQQNEKWVFFALIYDGTQQFDTLKIIHISDPSHVAIASHDLSHIGSLRSDGASSLILGDRSFNDATFRGFLTDIRFFGSYEDASGALDLRELLTNVFDEGWVKYGSN